MLQGRSREDLADDELFMHDTAAQSAMAGTENIVRGTGQAIGGVWTLPPALRTRPARAPRSARG